MTERDASSKEAEKRYLARTGGSAWEREKPFPPGDADTFDESLELLSDFLVAVRLLRPTEDDRIIDLGAGGGWCSDLLQRLQRNTVAVDISLDMLRVARTRRIRRPISAVVGDLERLPFVDGSFEKAICLSAIHHVPDIPKALEEISRVLTSDGVAVFSEPGKGHANKPWSVSAAQDFGVLEQDIEIEPFIAACEAAGFQHAYLCPISYAIPEFELTKEEWAKWKQLPRTKRPWRALDKMRRALMEMFGLAKESILFEEAFAMRLVRLLQVPVEEHPFILAAKSPERRQYRQRYSATIKIEGVAEYARPHERISASLVITNHGSAQWRTGESTTGHVRLGIQLLDREGRVVHRDFARVSLPHDVSPGSSVGVLASFSAPGQPSTFLLKFDLVAEGVAWFEPSGTRAPTARLIVRDGP
jgi:ubiquinone/menaquinone biosynthesis C-methylase UbiE